jgi:hypothetical protein
MLDEERGIVGSEDVEPTLAQQQRQLAGARAELEHATRSEQLGDARQHNVVLGRLTLALAYPVRKQVGGVGVGVVGLHA